MSTTVETEILKRWKEKGIINDAPETSKNGSGEANQAAPIIQLPLWPEPARAAPSAILRSALFGVVRRGRRKSMKREALASWKTVVLEYTGEQLDQYDLNVWMQAIHLARLQSLSDANGVSFTSRGFLKAMKRTYSGAAAKALHDSIHRMVACAVTIRVGDCEYMGNLIHSCAHHEESGRYVLHLNPKLRDLFDSGYTRLDWETRLTLTTDFSRWLHGYVQSQRATACEPHRIAVITLKELSGSETDPRDFRRKLRLAMESLKRKRVVSRWRITDNDALEFVRFVKKEGGK
ncbi:MAG TPA: plasmid replication initiator TrfA [Oculatellaceae cyanobacterium]